MDNWDLLAKYLSGECTATEEAEIAKKLETDSEFANLYRELKQVWQAPDDKLEASDIDKLWEQVAGRTGIRRTKVVEFAPKTSRKRSLTPAILRAAAVFILVISASVYIVTTQFRQPSLSTATVAFAERDTVLLADGSSVILDAGSSLRYPESLKRDSREVYLEGEGFFTVAHNPESPFIVHAGHSQVEVLGTEFNVRAWKIDPEVSVFVQSGRVRFGPENSTGDSSVVLTKDQFSSRYILREPSQPLVSTEQSEMDWMSGIAKFDGVPLNRIRYHLERWYGCEIVFEDTSVLKEQFTIQIRRDAMEDALDLLSTLGGLRYSQDGDTIRFYN